MSTEHKLAQQLTRYPAVAVACYVALLLAFVLVTWSAVADLYDRYVSLGAATDMLSRIEGRKLSAGPADALGAGAPAGSPFLEGRTIALAGAGLEQRVTGAITKAGGSVLSTQVDLNSAQTKKGVISLIVSCQVKQPGMQQVLYDLEAGMPFLFIDQLEVQAPQATGEDGGVMRILMTVSGQWRG
jgi:general secretion pathway protein M